MFAKYRVGLLAFHSEASADRYADKNNLKLKRTFYGYLIDIAMPAAAIAVLMFSAAVALLIQV